jgi:predicted  nucleic acid-binding Zn-ribbon protein
MTDQPGTDLKELQKLDNRIEEARRRIADFDPRLQEVEEPALLLQSELGTAKSRLQELKLEERRLELSTEEKRTRRKRLDERLGSVRNLREEAAVSAELEMVKRALQNDEQETLSLLDQLRKMEERARELEINYAEASERVGPKRDELMTERAEAEKELEALRAERARFVSAVNTAELKIYDAIRAGGRTTAVADLTEDGACGHCFGMVPLQLRNEIRHGTELIRCESCGVILTAPTPAAVASDGNVSPGA